MAVYAYVNMDCIIQSYSVEKKISTKGNYVCKSRILTKIGNFQNINHGTKYNRIS